MRVFVGDNGIGMPRPQLESLFSEKNPGIHPNGSGIALKNVNARLTVLYGTKHALHIESEPDKGTTVSFTVPQ